MPQATNKITITLPINAQRLCDLLTSAVTGSAITYWAQSAMPSKEAQKLEESYWYYEPKVLLETQGHIFVLKYDLPKLPEGNGKGKKFVSLGDLRLGLKSMALSSPAAFADWLNSQDDMLTADVFMQHVVFGEVIYG